MLETHCFGIYSKQGGSWTYLIQNRLSNLDTNLTAAKEVAWEENSLPRNYIWLDEVGAHYTFEQNEFFD